MKRNQMTAVKKEIKRLSRMAAMGGSSAHSMFYAQAVALVEKYNLWGENLLAQFGC